MVEYLAASGVLRHQIDGVLRLHHLVEPGNVRMMEQLQDGNFTKGLGEVVIVEAGLVDDLDGNLEKIDLI